MALCIRFLTKSIKQAARAKQWDAALSLFAEAVASSEVDAAAFNAAMNACVAVQKWAMALHLFEKMEDYKVEVNKYVLATCMRAYGEAALWYVAIAKLAEQLSSRTSGIEADDVLFGVLITQCGKATEWRLALELFQEMKQRSVPQAEGQKLTLFACERGSAWLHALKLLEGLGDHSSYNSAISSCGKAQQWISSISLLAEMGQKEILPDAVTWNCLLSSLEKGAQWQRALILLSEGTRSCRMGQNAAISACANASAWKQALAAFQRVKDKDVVTYNATITSCTKGRQTSRSLRLFKEMKDLKVSPDVVTLGAILNACEKGASWADAVSLLLQEKQPSIVLFNMVASSCAKGHQWQHALWILREVRRQRLRADATSFNSVMAACLRGEEWEHSLSLFQELKCLNAMLTLPSYVEALGSFHQAQRWEAALQTFLEVPKPDLQVLGAAFRAAGSWQQALCFLNTYSAESDTICTLLTLAAVDQAGQGHRLTELTRRLRRDLLRCVRAGELRGAEATAVHFLMVLGLMDAGDSCQAQELEHYFRSLCKTVYEPALQHCRDRSWDTQISIVDEWSSFEMASRDAASLLGFRPGSMLSRSERNVKY